MTLCIVRGTGDVGSAVAHVLFRQGWSVVLHDVGAPGHPRRGMAFADALFDGTARLGDVRGKRARDLDDLPRMLDCRQAIPVVCGPLQSLILGTRPEVLIDARMRKRQLPEVQRGLASLTIGLGPGFEAGVQVDIAVETAWGDGLGAVIMEGKTSPLAGEPKAIAGVGRERNVYAPVAGRFTTGRQIGERVRRGDRVADIDAHPLCAPIDGCLRGLTHDGVEVAQGAKVVEIDPRGEPALCFGLGERPLRIAEGVLAAVNRRLREGA